MSEHLHRVPSLSYHVSFYIPADINDSMVNPYLDLWKNAETCRNNTRLSLEFMRYMPDLHCIHYNLHFTRMAESNEEWRDFYGMWPNQRDVSYVESGFDPKVQEEISTNLGSLPPPFDTAFELAKKITIHSRVTLDSVQVPFDRLPRRLTGNTASAPAVIIGDAAHKVPQFIDPDSIAHACLDGVFLGENIVAAAEDDELFRLVPEHFYRDSQRRWRYSAS